MQGLQQVLHVGQDDEVVRPGVFVGFIEVFEAVYLWLTKILDHESFGNSRVFLM